MPKSPPFPFLPDLEMPLRDALRGVANFAEATEEAIEPAAKLLPMPLRSGFYKALRSIETTGKRVIKGEVQTAQIAMSADFVTGRTTDPNAAKTCAKVVCFAWGHLQHSSRMHRYLISETILSGRMCSVSAHETGERAAFAAALFSVIRQSSAIGRMPGLAGTSDAEEKAEIDIALVSILVWLLSARGASIAEEEKLLELAQALIFAIRPDVLDVIEDATRLADILENASAHL